MFWAQDSQRSLGFILASTALWRTSTYIAKADQIQLSAHASDVGSAHVGAVHQAHAVHGADGEDEASVNTVDYAPLFRWSEAMAEVVFGLGLAGRLDVTVVQILLRFRYILEGCHWKMDQLWYR
jgi:hypothetical protein